MSGPSFSWITNPSRKALVIAAILLFAGSAFYFSFYVQGIPYEQEEGITRGWADAANTSWKELFTYLLSPKSNEIKADGSNLITVRVTESILHKLIYILFGQSMTAMTIFNIFVTAIFAVFVFLLGFKILNNLLIAFLATAYLLLMPAYGWNSMEFGSYSPLDQLLLIAYLMLFAYCLERSFWEDTGKHSKIRVALFSYTGLWFLGMCAIRAKEPNIFLVPALSWFVLLLNPARNIWKASPFERKRILGLAAVVGLLTLPMVWANKHPDELNPFWDCPVRVFMWNPNGWEPETVPCLLTLERTMPVSVLSNFGFFLGWVIVIGAIFVSIHMVKNRPAAGRGRLIYWPALLFVWFLISEAFFIHFCSVEFIRHQVWILLPFTLLVALLFKNLIELCKGRRVLQYIVILALLVLSIEKTVNNVSYSIFIRQHLERLWVTKWEFREAIYKDINQTHEAPLFELYHYWHFPSNRVRALFPFMESEQDKTDLLQSEEFLSHLREFKTAYVVSPKPVTSLFPGLRLELIHHFDLNKASWLTTVKKRKRNPRPYYLYRVTSDT